MRRVLSTLAFCFLAGASVLAVEPRNRRPYSDVDFSTCLYINGATHMHAPTQEYIDQAREHNIEFFTISNYYPSAPTYPAAKMKVPRGFPYADQGLTYNGLYVKGHFDWKEIVGKWEGELPAKTARAFDIRMDATYPFRDERKPMYSHWDRNWLEAPNAEHHNFIMDDGTVHPRLHVCAPGSLFTSGNFDSKNNFLLETHGFARGCGLGWRESFVRMISELIYPDGGGITINHPTWSNLDREFLLEMLDFDSRVLGIEVVTEENNNEHYWDWVLSTGRQCFGFFTPDWMTQVRKNFGVCVLLVPERTQHACLRAYRNGNFYGALIGKGALKFTSISFSRERVHVSTDKPARFEVKTAFGVVASGEGTEFEWRLPAPKKGYRGSAVSHVFARVKAYALDGSGEVLFTQPYIIEEE